jgi:hypothetical protein
MAGVQLVMMVAQLTLLVLLMTSSRSVSRLMRPQPPHRVASKA